MGRQGNEMELCMLTLWSIWKSRCTLAFEKESAQSDSGCDGDSKGVRRTTIGEDSRSETDQTCRSRKMEATGGRLNQG